MQINLVLLDSWTDSGSSVSTVSINGITEIVIIKPYTVSSDKEIMITALKRYFTNPEKYN